MRKKKLLLAFTTEYTLITFYFIYGIWRDQSTAWSYLFTFPIFWIFAGIILGLLFWFKKIRVQTTVDKFLIFFSTPLPLLLVLIILNLVSSNHDLSSYEYKKDGHWHKELRYDYSVGQPQRVEYYISKGTVTESKPFPESKTWVKDSIWIYYNKDGTISKTEKHSN